jgi:Cu/Ag efflux protein CusF
MRPGADALPLNNRFAPGTRMGHLSPMIRLRSAPLFLAALVGTMRAADVPSPPAAPVPPWSVKLEPVPGADAPRAFAGFPDGSALVVFRGHAADGVCDLQFSLWREGRWSDPKVLIADGWKPAVPPAAGPALALRGTKVAVAWFSVVDDNPRIQVSLSSNAGRVWQIPLRVSEDTPDATVAVALLPDESEVVCWKEGSRLLLRRISPQDDSGPLTPLAEVSGPVESLRLTALADQDENAPVRLLVDYAAGGHTGASVVTLPTLKQLAAQDNTCACDTHITLVRGFALSGVVVARDQAAGTVTVRHAEIPGVMPAMTMPFKAPPDIWQTLAPGKEFLGRMEEKEGAWWLFDVRVLEPAGK